MSAKRHAARKKANTGGRPEKCTPERIALAVRFTLLGAKEKEICAAIGISTRTFRAWMQVTGPYFQQAFFEAVDKAQLDYKFGRVERSYLEQALGFYYTEEVATKDGPMELKKYQPPNERAARFILCNRMPEKYKEKAELSGNVNFTFADFMRTVVKHEDAAP